MTIASIKYHIKVPQMNGFVSMTIEHFCYLRISQIVQNNRKSDNLKITVAIGANDFTMKFKCSFKTMNIVSVFGNHHS